MNRNKCGSGDEIHSRTCFYPGRGKEGFSLIEAMVVIVMIAIMAAWGYPQVMNIMPRYRLKQAARSIYQNIQLAKMTAIKEGSQVVAAFDSQGYILFLDNNNNFINDSADQVIKAVKWSEFSDVSLKSCNFPSSMIGFTPDGRTRNNTGGLGIGTVEIESSAGAGSLKVVVSSAGNVKVE